MRMCCSKATMRMFSEGKDEDVLFEGNDEDVLRRQR